MDNMSTANSLQLSGPEIWGWGVGAEDQGVFLEEVALELGLAADIMMLKQR
jgi:hypothetical protein